MIGMIGARLAFGHLAGTQLLKNRYLWLALALLVLLIGLLIFSAPASNRLESGSTWSRAPAGYSAWFESLADEGIRINRWQRPVPQLIDLLENGPDEIEGSTTTLIKAAPAQEGSDIVSTMVSDIVSTMVVVLPGFFEEADLPGLVPWLPDWIAAGHRLVLLGVKTPATAAPFSQTIASPFGGVRIDTRRRQDVSPEPRQLLADDYGTVIWRDPWQLPPNESNTDLTPLASSIFSHRLAGKLPSKSPQFPILGESEFQSPPGWGDLRGQRRASLAQNSLPATTEPGELIFVATPFLAANAFLNASGNFAQMTDLVTHDGGQVWVDEYLHGYRDMEDVAAELGSESWLAYLARTPWLVFAAQATAITLLALLALNHRLGNRLTVQESVLDNSQAYITALAGVLHKANSHDFVVQTITQSERGRLQQSLGLGNTPVSDEQLTTAWVQQTGGTAADLAPLLQPRPSRQDDQIKAWLKQLQFVHQFTQSRTPGHE